MISVCCYFVYPMCWTIFQYVKVITVKVIKETLANISFSDVDPYTLFKDAINTILIRGNQFNLCFTKYSRSLLNKRHFISSLSYCPANWGRNYLIYREVSK